MVLRAENVEEHHRTLASKAAKVSIRTPVWMVMSALAHLQ
jgi:hypothetical protein